MKDVRLLEKQVFNISTFFKYNFVKKLFELNNIFRKAVVLMLVMVMTVATTMMLTTFKLLS